MAPKIDSVAGRYLMILHDGDALPTVSPETAVRPGTLAIRYPSRDAWVYTGREWLQEPTLAEITLGKVQGLLEQMLALQEQQLALWKQQVV